MFVGMGRSPREIVSDVYRWRARWWRLRARTVHRWLDGLYAAGTPPDLDYEARILERADRMNAWAAAWALRSTELLLADAVELREALAGESLERYDRRCSRMWGEPIANVGSGSVGCDDATGDRASCPHCEGLGCGP